MSDQDLSDTTTTLELLSPSEEAARDLRTTLKGNKQRKKRKRPTGESDCFVGKSIAERYEILNVLGQGGMSTVYRARHVLTKKLVALKLMHPHMILNPQSMRRFQQEAMAASRLAHPNVISVHDMGVTDEGRPFLVMDYLEGTSLASIIKEGLLPIERTLPILLQVCAALNHAHQHGVVHRDLKPSNIMLTLDDDGRELVKVVDFGIAKIITSHDDKSMDITRTGEVFGSPLYMSPEQWLGQPLDVRSDVYSTGCVMYELLTGAAPFAGSNVFETMYKQVHQLPNGFAALELDSRLKRQLEHIAFKAMAKDPKERYQDMRTFRLDLTSALTFAGGGSRLLASLNLRLDEYTRSLANKFGRLGIAFLIVGSSLVSITALLAGSILPQPDKTPVPPPAQRTMIWQPVLPSFAENPEEFTSKELIFKLSKHNARELSGFSSAESFYATKRLAEFYRAAGKYEPALGAFNSALEVTRRNKINATIDVADVESGRGECYYHLGDLMRAKNSLMAGLRIYNTLEYAYTDCFLDLALLGDCYERAGDADLAKTQFDQLLAIWLKRPDRLDLNRLNWCLVIAADYYANHGKPEQARQLYEDAILRWTRLRRGELNIAWAYHQLALVYAKQERFDEADEYFRLSDEMLVKVQGERSLVRAYLLLDLSDLQWRRHQWLESTKTRKNAMSMLDELRSSKKK